MEPLDKAILICDATFSWGNAGKHLPHAKQMGITNKEYKKGAKELSEATPSENIIHYKRKDGREVKLNKTTKEYVVYSGNRVITYYKLSESQFQRALKGEY